MSRCSTPLPSALNIVADGHILFAREAFSSLPGIAVRLTILPASAIGPEALTECDVLLTRSSVQVNQALLAGTPVRFVATATVGDDHVDRAFLKAAGIAFASAAGSSTRSVLEYLLAALLELHAAGHLVLPQATVGVIGAGRIGSALAAMLRPLGVRLLLNDPPRAAAEGEGSFVPLAQLLAESDLISLHTPLTRTGSYPTYHLIGNSELAAFRGNIIINAARGGVVESGALKNWLAGGVGRQAVLDCWEGEPAIDGTFFDAPGLFLGTPHIAGHSLDGKAANTQAVYDALCGWLGVEPACDLRTLLPPPLTLLPGDEGTSWPGRLALARRCYDIRSDDRTLRQAAKSPEIAKEFNRLRREYPPRRSWPWLPQ